MGRVLRFSYRIHTAGEGRITNVSPCPSRAIATWRVLSPFFSLFPFLSLSLSMRTLLYPSIKSEGWRKSEGGLAGERGRDGRRAGSFRFGFGRKRERRRGKEEKERAEEIISRNRICPYAPREREGGRERETERGEGGRERKICLSSSPRERQREGKESGGGMAEERGMEGERGRAGKR